MNFSFPLHLLKPLVADNQSNQSSEEQSSKQMIFRLYRGDAKDTTFPEEYYLNSSRQFQFLDIEINYSFIIPHVGFPERLSACYIHTRLLISSFHINYHYFSK